MFTTQDLTNIETAIATGQLSVEQDGQKVQYRSMNELLKAKTVIEAALGIQPIRQTLLFT